MTAEPVFDEAFEALMLDEGGYVLDPQDPGGETKYGISKRAYPDLDISALTKEDAKAIYYRDYWSPIYGSTLARPIALVMFDTAVNQGVKTAIVFAQRAVTTGADGIMGVGTRYALEKIDPKIFVVEFTTHRMLHYAGLSTFPRFGRGWTRRALRTLGRALT